MDYNLLKNAVETLFSGQNPYVRLTNFLGPHNYPPTAFLFLVFLQNRLIFDILSSLAFFLSIFLLTNKKVFVACILFLGFSVTFFPYKFNGGMGQINDFILLFIVLAYYYNPIFLAYAICIKLTPMIFIFYYFIKRDFKKIIITFIFIMLLILLTLFIVPLNYQLVYFTDVFWRAFGSGGKEVYYNQSLAGLLSRANLQILFYPITALLLFITWFRSKNLTKERIFSAVTCLMLMLNPIAWQHHFVLAVIPLIFLFKFNKLLVIISYLLLAWNFKQPGLIPNELLSHQFYGIFILWTLTLFGKNTSKIIGTIGVLGIIGVYCRFLLCRGAFCF